jgi:hypothetical protein
LGRMHSFVMLITMLYVIRSQYYENDVDLGGLVVSVLATGPKVRGFGPDRGRWIFKGDKNPEHHFLRRRSKAIGPMNLTSVNRNVW